MSILTPLRERPVRGYDPLFRTTYFEVSINESFCLKTSSGSIPKWYNSFDLYKNLILEENPLTRVSKSAYFETSQNSRF